MGNAVASGNSLAALVAIVVEREWWNTVSKASRWSPGRIVVEVRRAVEVGCHMKRASKCWYRRVLKCRSHSPAWCSGRRAVRLCRWDALEN